MKKKRVERLAYRNNFVKKNILNFFFVIVLANVFLGCTKYETYIDEIKIVGTRVSDIDSTSANLILILGGNTWLIDYLGGNLIGYKDDNFSYFWYEIGYNEDWNWEWGLHLEGLLPGTTYYWIPSIQKDSIIVRGEPQVFITKY
ncbi:MAG: hypothetical protein FWH36_03095 [Lentimicrobiaceae bacterium]|nr:hypothetical protein [Lentimicrobiaceae bacterium]